MHQLDLSKARTLVQSILDDLPMTPHVAPQAERPEWMVTIRYNAPTHDRVDRFTTAGVLIGPRHVLTVGHLFSDAIMEHLPPDEPRLAQRNFFAQVGTTQLGTGEHCEIKRVETTGFVPAGNPGFEDVDEVNDLAVLYLDRAVTAIPIKIADQAAARGGTVHFFGWPKGDDGTRELTQVTTTVIDPVACATGYRGQDEFCAANVAGDHQLQPGYSGGPVIRIPDGGAIGDAELVGLSSRGANGLGDDIPPPALVVDIAGRHRQFVLGCLHAQN